MPSSPKSTATGPALEPLPSSPSQAEAAAANDIEQASGTPNPANNTKIISKVYACKLFPTKLVSPYLPAGYVALGGTAKGSSALSNCYYGTPDLSVSFTFDIAFGPDWLADPKGAATADKSTLDPTGGADTREVAGIGDYAAVLYLRHEGKAGGFLGFVDRGIGYELKITNVAISKSQLLAIGRHIVAA